MADWPYEQVESLHNHVRFLHEGVENMDVIASLRSINAIHGRITEAAAAVLEIAAVETKITQKDLAIALGVPQSTLRGLRSGR